MPFGEYENFDACVSSNSDKDDPEAYCAAVKRKIEGESALSDSESKALEESECPEGKVSINGECVPVTEVDDVPPNILGAPRVLSMRQLAGPIERVENNDGTVTYKNLKILSEGVWTDQKSKQPTHYVPKNLEVQEDNTVNVMHDANNDVSDVGTIDPDSTFVEDGDLYADVTLHMENAASEYADENLQTTLESGGEKGFGGPSVEIPADGLDIEKDGELGYPKTASGKINGMGFVGTPAAKTTAFDQQTRERQVALSSDQSTMLLEQKDDSMSPELDLEALREQYSLSEDVDEDTIAELAEAGALTLEEDEDDEEEDEEEDAEMEEDDEDPDDDGEDEDNPDEDEDMELEDEVEDLRAEVDELRAVIEEMQESMMSESELSDELEDTKEELADAETVEELAEAKEELDKRLSSIEDESKEPRSLAEGNADDWEPEYDNTPSQTSSW